MHTSSSILKRDPVHDMHAIHAKMERLLKAEPINFNDLLDEISGKVTLRPKKMTFRELRHLLMQLDEEELNQCSGLTVHDIRKSL